MLLRKKGMIDLKKFIRQIPDWPKPGINFKDISPLLQNSDAFALAVQKLCLPFAGSQIDKIAGIDARGFIFASVCAHRLKKGFIMARKKDKLPPKVVSTKYALEYSENELEIQIDSVKQGENVLIIDDVLATGGTTKATAELIEKLGGNIVGYSFLIELTGLKGRKMLSKYKINSIIKYKW